MLKKRNYRKRKNCWRQDIRKGEYLTGCLEAVGAAGLTAILFYRSVAAVLILLLPVGGTFLYVWEKEKLKRKEREFTRQFLDALQSVSASLNVGYSLENSLLEAAKELRIMYREQDRILKEWNYMIRQMKMNVGVEEILEEFSERVDQEDVRNFVTVTATVKKSGGNMAKVIRQTISQIQEKEELNQEIETVISAKKMEFLVMAVIPFGMIAYMMLSFPEFMEVLYQGIPGRIVMTGCLVLYLAAFGTGFRMIQIEV